VLPRKRQERCPEEVLREHAIMGGRRGWQLLRECESGLTRGGIASMVPARPLYVLHRTSGIDRKPEMAWRGGTGYTAPHKIAGSGPGAAQGSAEAVAAAVPGWGVCPHTGRVVCRQGAPAA
jgi:hypothetical protein